MIDIVVGCIATVAVAFFIIVACASTLHEKGIHINEAKDAANYTAKGKYYAATPQNFFLFFPDDVHRPDIRVKGYDTLKKLVIKIRHKQF